jgi:16S rRNA processing protein RimM
MPRMIVMGRITGPFGVRGWVKVQTFTGEPGSLGRFPQWYLGGTGEWRQAGVEDWEVHGDHMVAKLSGCPDREAAAALRGSEIAVPRESLPATAENEFYQADLLGLEVVNRSDERLGRVDRIFSNGAHDIMAVRASGGEATGERLIPFIPQVVDRVDVAAGEIRVDWGLDW